MCLLDGFKLFFCDFDTGFLFPWMKLSWHSGSMWDKLGWLWQFLCDSLSSFNTKPFYYSYVSSCILCEGRTLFAWDLSLENSADSYLWFQRSLPHSVSYFFLNQSPVSSLPYLSFYMGLISGKLCRFLLMLSTHFTSCSFLLLSPLLITLFIFMHGFWFYFT